MITEQDIIEDLLIDRYGYECERCHWRSHTDVNRNHAIDMMLCDECSAELLEDAAKR